MGLQPLTTSTNPVSLDDAKAHLRIDGTDDDATVTGYLAAALDYVETETRQQLLSRNYVLALDDFPCGREQPNRCIQLPKPPLQSVASVTYLDAFETRVTLDPTAYTVDTITVPGRIVLKSNQAWPTTDRSAGNVRISFTAGHADVSLIPAGLIQCIKLMTGQFYENREAATDRRIDVVPMAIESLIQQNSFPEAVG